MSVGSPAAKSNSPGLAQPTVVVCAVTFRRPEWLAKLLRGIAELRFAHAQPIIRVVIVENEENGPGAKVCEELQAGFPFPLEWYAEPKRGIPCARNTAVARAGAVDFIAFLDDDEVPEPNWLDELLRVQAQYDADLVAGPVLPVYEQPPPEWIVRGGFHQRTSYPTGNPALPMGTNNLLIRRAALEGIGTPFDERLALISGEDTHLFRRMESAGRTSVWADSAKVKEWIPPSRCTAKWICQRAFRTGSTSSVVTRDLVAPPRSWLHLLWRAALHIGYGVLSLPVNVFRGRHAAMMSVKYFVRGLGIFFGLFGVKFEEYRKIHGR
jgi:hypothetical protein